MFFPPKSLKMLIPKVEIPAYLEGSSSSSDFTELTCCEMLLSHLALISPPMLEMTNISVQEETQDSSEARIHRLATVVSKVPCMMDVSFLDSDAGLIKLLDAGLLVAFMANNRPKEDIRASVQPLPKSRVGMILSLESEAAVVEAISTFRDIIGNFMFKYVVCRLMLVLLSPIAYSRACF